MTAVNIINSLEKVNYASLNFQVHINCCISGYMERENGTKRCKPTCCHDNKWNLGTCGSCLNGKVHVVVNGCTGKNIK
jgi:hypothetical protein